MIKYRINVLTISNIRDIIQSQTKTKPPRG
nr:MAG TPA: hypothetical protein [Caudoviricetes sp.]